MQKRNRHRQPPPDSDMQSPRRSPTVVEQQPQIRRRGVIPLKVIHLDEERQRTPHRDFETTPRALIIAEQLARSVPRAGFDLYTAELDRDADISARARR